MSQSLRQSELFAGNDWLAIYRAFTQINFNASDYTSIRESMINYIQQTYPEDFNDWIDSSDFVMLIDLMSTLGENLAFITDINARENIIDIARRRESVLRLSRFLSYSPQRNLPATGLVKLKEISVTTDVYDSNGNNLINQVIVWDDPNNLNWYDQWISVINSILVPTNPFNTPLNEITLDGTLHQLYRVNSSPIGPGNYPFTAFVANQTMDFDICNVNLSEKYGIIEQVPNPQSSFHILYKSDGNGNSSNNTGFFMLFKQGNLTKSDFYLASPIENRTLLIPTDNINQSDLWVHSVLDDGTIITNGEWTRVNYQPTNELNKIQISTNNITFNDISTDIRNLYQDITQENDRVLLRFGDGRFSKIPTGNIRAWHRVSANQNLIIRAIDISDKSITIPYFTNTNTVRQIQMTFSLMETVTNATVSETDDEIRRRASEMYKTQGRMVSGEDYNTLPSASNLIQKIKTVNRIYSGQSRYIDLNDPTATYQNLNIFSDDGAIFSENKNILTEISNNQYATSTIFVDRFLMPMITDSNLANFVYNDWIVNSEYDSLFQVPSNLVWNIVTKDTSTTTGFFTLNGSPVQIGDFAVPGSVLNKINDGSMIRINNLWYSILSIDQNSSINVLPNGAGPITINGIPKNNYTVTEMLPNFNKSWSANFRSELISRIDDKQSFGIGYDIDLGDWYTIDSGLINRGDYDYFSRGSGSDSSWLFLAQYSSIAWNITSRGLRYVGESEKAVKFYNITNYRNVNYLTGKVSRDEMIFLKYNFNAPSSDKGFYLLDQYRYPDGFLESKRVFLEFKDVDSDGQPDNPLAFMEIVGDYRVYHIKKTDQLGYDFNQLLKSNNGIMDPEDLDITERDPSSTSLLETPYGVDIVNDKPTNYYNRGPNGEWVLNTTDKFTCNPGRCGLSFQWKHVAPYDQRIDPSPSNIMDIFVLTRSYYDEMINWRTMNFEPSLEPDQPTTTQLKYLFKDFEEYKMFSDEIVWRPTKFKYLFGQNAEPELRAKFKIVKVQGTLQSDGEIRTQVLQIINDFFDVNNWDFGETFYFTELSNYIHQRMAGSVGSVVIVPSLEDQGFGGLFEIRSLPDELFFPVTRISDIEIISSNTQSNLRIK